MLAARKLVTYSVEISPLYEVRPSSVEGLGVFCLRDVNGSIGVFYKDGQWASLGRYINHSDDPNCSLETEGSIIKVVAKAKQGDELLLNYFYVKDYMEASE